MTDNEIIKALKCCIIDNHIDVCKECSFTDVCDEDEQALQKHALDLINRQKAEVERFVTPKKPIAFKRTAHDFETGVCPYSHYDCEHIKPYSHEYEYTDYRCPACNKVVSGGTPEYCCHCGQALDWSDK